jgi:ferredoxin-type protein NapH
VGGGEPVATSGTAGLRRNRLARLGFFFVGLALFYAPFALLVRGAGVLFPASSAGTGISDAHTACLRMPLGWLVQPWMWSSFSVNPLYALTLVVLPVAALAAGPFFCGWLCPAGAFPEFLGRLVPDRFKFDPRGKVHIVPLRYGFLVGFLLVPFVAASICCSLCNFNQMQNIVGLAFGNLAPWTYFSTTGLLTLVIWIVPLGLFTSGGRGWCLFLCPVGAVSGLASAGGSRFGFLPRVRGDAAVCTACGTCERSCPMRAVDVSGDPGPRVDQHLCNECMDCVSSCPSGAMTYGRRT